MKSVGARIAFWYALASLLTLGCFFRVGRFLVEEHMEHSLDAGIAAEFAQVTRRLGPDVAGLDGAQIKERLSLNPSVRYFIEIHDAGDRIIYRSRNLREQVIPALAKTDPLLTRALARVLHFASPGAPASIGADRRSYNGIVGDLGEMRVGEFKLAQLTVRVATSNEQVRSLVAAYQDVFYGMVAFMAAASAVIGFALSHFLLRPLRQIQATATHISSDNLGERIPVSTVDDEISRLARLLNQMFDRLEAAFNQTRRFSAEASHELKTPLSLIRLQAEKLLIENDLKPAQEEALQVQLEEIARLNKIIEELLFLSRAEVRAITLQAQPHDTRAYLETFATDARVLAESRGVHLATEFAADGRAVFDARWIRQVLLNALANALAFAPRGSTVTLASRFVSGAWQVAIDDEGPGVPAEQREHIFERFVRLAPNQGSGSGLGLAISRSIVELHRGTIRAETARNGTGLRLVFEIPAGS